MQDSISKKSCVKTEYLLKEEQKRCFVKNAVIRYTKMNRIVGHVDIKCRTEIPVMRSEEKMGAQHGLANPAKMIILSILLLLSVFFLPMYNRGLIMGEIYPNDQSLLLFVISFFEAIKSKSNA